MSSRHIQTAILLLVLANLMAAFSDVSLKVLNGEVPTFEYVLIRQLMSLVCITPLWLRLPKAQRMAGCCKYNFWRAQFILIGSACAMIAITHLPLATANAMFYVAPLMMLPLSALFLKEVPPMTKIVATGVGFVGVLVVLRPDNFHWAAIIALGSALAMAVGNILIRKLPQQQSVVVTLFWTTILTLPGALILALLNWQSIELHHLAWIAAINCFVLSYHALAVFAYRKAEAGQIALAEYSGLVFATIFGVLWFNEVPDVLTSLGILLIVVPLMPIRWKKQAKPHLTVEESV
ncbi:DMT family transporter [Vibrio gallicus]|uniref:DMT family transporter n=1 Tax=Vibrio gallicus TaxID=190897 RepID=UPI0021C47611|nr:DMT family transporter [Vibrio gallicus]